MLIIIIKYAGDGTSLKEKVMNRPSFFFKWLIDVQKLLLEAFISGPMYLFLGNTFFVLFGYYVCFRRHQAYIRAT